MAKSNRSISGINGTVNFTRVEINSRILTRGRCDCREDVSNALGTRRHVRCVSGVKVVLIPDQAGQSRYADWCLGETLGSRGDGNRRVRRRYLRELPISAKIVKESGAKDLSIKRRTEGCRQIHKHRIDAVHLGNAIGKIDYDWLTGIDSYRCASRTLNREVRNELGSSHRTKATTVG